MANICDNNLRAYSTNPENLEVIKKFFDDYSDSYIEVDNNELTCFFTSKWTFPEDDMQELYEKLPDKEDIYITCLSVEYGCLYHALWVCEEDGWYQP